MDVSLQVLGCNSAIPSIERNASAQWLQSNDLYILIDCGEGTLKQAMLYKVKLFRVQIICISHLHGDHYFGLFGVLTSLNLMGRKENLIIICPKALIDIIHAILAASSTELQYSIEYIPIILDEEQLVLDSKKVQIRVRPLDHRIQCFAFQFIFQKLKFKLNIELIKQLQITLSNDDLKRIALGDSFNVTDLSGNQIDSTILRNQTKESKQYTYVTDTSYLPELSTFIEGSDFLYHEATYPKGEELHAALRKHSTAFEAVQIAEASKVPKLLIGHFSSKYSNKQVQDLFKVPTSAELELIIANDGLRIEF